MPERQGTFAQQTGALVQKSWTYQKRNIGSNICLCVAPILFCAILAIVQALVSRLLTSSGDSKCGCLCTQCCPTWALTSIPNNFTANGNGSITILPSALQSFGGYAGITTVFPSSAITNNTDGSITVYTCGPAANGPCAVFFSCLKTDSNQCGVQYSNPAQAQFCKVPQPSTWPALVNAPARVDRADPWASTVVNGQTIPRTATLITGGSSPALQSAVSNALFTGNITSDPALWNQAFYGPNALNAGNATNPDVGLIYNGDWLTRLGFQFGTDADPPQTLYIEQAFQQGITDSSSLYVMFPANMCLSKGISPSSSMCLSQLLKLYFADNTAVNQTWLSTLPSCQGSVALSQNPNNIISTLYVNVTCTENAIVPQTSVADLEALLFCGYYQARCELTNTNSSWYNQLYQGAYDLATSSPSTLDVNVYYNQTLNVDGSGAPSNGLQYIPGSVANAVSAWWASVSNSASAAGVQLLGVSGMPQDSIEAKFDFASLLGPLFFTWVVQLLFPTFVQQLVYEKEKRLRMMMKMHGLGDLVYWIVTYAWFLLLYIVYIIIFIIIGAVLQLKMFTKTNLGIQIIFYFLQGNCMIAFAFMLSSIFTSARTAVVVGFLYVFGTGLLGQLLFKTFMDQNRQWMFFIEWVPAWSLYRGLYEISAYTQLGVAKGTSGMQFSNLQDEGNGMVATWGIFIVEWFIFMVLGLYLEQVISSGTGIRRHPLFFIKWMWSKKQSQYLQEPDIATGQSLQEKMHMMHSHAVGMAGADVQAERARVDALTDYSNTPIVVKDIKKIYPGQDGTKPKMAVKSLTLGIQRGECFGLLGPNGAGKTTSIHMLTGFLEPTGGTGVVEGHDIRTDMHAIYQLMGVCPQHDLLWEQLTGREHLRFYGRLKGLTGQTLEESIVSALKAVNLFNAGVADKQAGKYSGGMKRRLSVAISFIGDPKVVYLDEPSTGLDPASRRNLWDVVQTSKEGRSIILTTHSMEEAEMLCDRLGIFVDGQLVCIGNPKEITSRYAGFLVFTISVPPSQEETARRLVARMSPNAVLTYALGGTLKYELPTSEVTLSQVFAQVNAAKNTMDIIDWGVANATLEEVFIKLAKGIGATTSDT